MDGEITARLRVVVADDERPARSFLIALLRTFNDVAIVGEADSGRAAVALIERERPDLALLDLQMPELDGIGVVRMLKPQTLPLIAFVTAYDEYAVRAFEINAVDYLLKPVDKKRLRETLNRAIERVEHAEIVAEQAARVGAAIDAYEAAASKPSYLERIPVRQREEVLIVPVQQIASIVAEGELLTITTVRNEHHTITYRLKDLEARLDPTKFVRLGRGTLANVELITRVTLMPGGLHVAILGNGQKLQVSRLQSRVLRERLLKLQNRRYRSDDELEPRGVTAEVALTRLLRNPAEAENARDVRMLRVGRHADPPLQATLHAAVHEVAGVGRVGVLAGIRAG